jgi:hypothetical protein
MVILFSEQICINCYVSSVAHRCCTGTFCFDFASYIVQNLNFEALPITNSYVSVHLLAFSF